MNIFTVFDFERSSKLSSPSRPYQLARTKKGSRLKSKLVITPRRKYENIAARLNTHSTFSVDPLSPNASISSITLDENRRKRKLLASVRFPVVRRGLGSMNQLGNDQLRLNGKDDKKSGGKGMKKSASTPTLKSGSSRAAIDAMNAKINLIIEQGKAYRENMGRAIDTGGAIDVKGSSGKRKQRDLHSYDLDAKGMTEVRGKKKNRYEASIEEKINHYRNDAHARAQLDERVAKLKQRGQWYQQKQKAEIERLRRLQIMNKTKNKSKKW